MTNKTGNSILFPLYIKRVYIATPYTAPRGFHAETRKAIHNTRYQMAVLVVASILEQQGDGGAIPIYVPYSPIVHWHPIAIASDMHETNHCHWLELDQSDIRASDEMWVYPFWKWGESDGIRAEIEYASQLLKKIRFQDPNVKGIGPLVERLHTLYKASRGS